MDQTGRCTTVITKASNCSYIYHNIEALCVAHSFATLSKDFFVVLHDMLKGRPEVSELYCVKSAKVPLMRFKVDGISIDVSYACLKVLYVPESVDILYLSFLRNIDDTS
ncbi:Nuclear poly(A) polymerase [Arachis hypogaea]|nr:Nuclear poly(A) polymerase [Arachis hypogaea]